MLYVRAIRGTLSNEFKLKLKGSGFRWAAFLKGCRLDGLSGLRLSVDCLEFYRLIDLEKKCRNR